MTPRPVPRTTRCLRLMAPLLPLLLAMAGGASLAQEAPLAGDPPYLQRDEVQAFVGALAEEGLDPDWVRAVLASAEPRQRVLDLISAPAEGKPWHQYRPIFVTPRRVAAGVEFWQTHERTLLRAQERYRVNAEILVAIIGVETFYGRHQGSIPVLDALVTLGFDYPPRARFFRSELGHFLHLVREEGLDPRETLGSYAGAMGRGQFISSSYREYAVDFDGDGRRDLMDSWPDAIGSVAHYFHRHGWTMGAPVAIPARVDGEDYKDLLGGGYRPRLTLDQLRQHGVRPAEGVDPQARFSLIQLETAEGPEFWLGLENFYVITRYNRSPLYAMAVLQLSREILRAREEGEGA
ncbi:lytic murein transglycosylase B [Ectothiorhodospira mobilis]|uniref:lytic murein transglycosylase B n=1 Tax=Ectothiorhodospira mobilis TaxID=195064 RepID=UPI003B75CDB6